MGASVTWGAMAFGTVCTGQGVKLWVSFLATEIITAPGNHYWMVAGAKKP